MPFGLSLSKPCSSLGVPGKAGQRFDRLSANGMGYRCYLPTPNSLFAHGMK